MNIALSELAHRINAEHDAVAVALQSALGHAIAAGEMLIEAKRQVKHGQWLPWLAANCSVPARTATHYMALARRRKKLSDQNGNVLPISVHEAVRWLRPLEQWPEPSGEDDREWGDSPQWGGLSWGVPFAEALQAVTHITQYNPPKPRYIVKAARAGKTPGLSATVLREAIALLTRYADALEAAYTDRTPTVDRPYTAVHREAWPAYTSLVKEVDATLYHRPPRETIRTAGSPG
jgi:hypothetical protein